MFEYAFFDLDGTLTDPSLGITNSIMHALRRMSKPVPPREELYRFIGPPLIPAFEEFIGMTHEEAILALGYYREYFGVKGLFENTVYDGIGEMLCTLSNNGVKIVLATSKPEEYAAQILEHFSLDKYFTGIYGATMDEKRVAKSDVISYGIEMLTEKLDTQAEQIRSHGVMIGDRRHDIEGGMKCSLSTVGVLWGFGSREELETAGADRIATDIQSLTETLLG